MRRIVFSAVASLAAAAPAAAKTPSVEALYELALKQQQQLESLQAQVSAQVRQIEILKGRAEAAEAKLGQAESTLAITSDQMMKVSTDLDLARAETREARAVVAEPAPEAAATPRRRESEYRASVDSLWLMPTSETLNFVKPSDNNNGVVGMENNLASVDYGLEPGFAVQLAWGVPNSRWTVMADASALHTSNTDRRLTGANTISAWGIDNIRGTQWEAYSSIERRTASIVGQYDVVDTADFQLGLISGVGFGQLEQRLKIKALAGTDANELVDNKASFTGAGPRVGLTAGYRLGAGFGLRSGLATNLMVGAGESYGGVDDTGAADDTIDRAAVSNAMRVVPMVDMRLAATYAHGLGPLRIGAELGMMVEHWMNLPGYARTSHNSVAGDFESTDMTFFGPYASIRAEF